MSYGPEGRKESDTSGVTEHTPVEGLAGSWLPSPLSRAGSPRRPFPGPQSQPSLSRGGSPAEQKGNCSLRFLALPLPSCVS